MWMCIGCDPNLKTLLIKICSGTSQAVAGILVYHHIPTPDFTRVACKELYMWKMNEILNQLGGGLANLSTKNDRQA